MEISIYSEKFWMFSYYMFHNVPNIIFSCIEYFWLYSTCILLFKRVAHTFHDISYDISKFWIIDHICTEIPADLDKIWNLRFYIKIWKFSFCMFQNVPIIIHRKLLDVLDYFLHLFWFPNMLRHFFHDNLWNIS